MKLFLHKNMKLFLQIFLLLFCCYGNWLNAQDATLTFTFIEDINCEPDGGFLGLGGTADISVEVNGTVVFQDDDIGSEIKAVEDDQDCDGDNGVSIVFTGAAGNAAFPVTFRIWEEDGNSNNCAYGSNDVDLAEVMTNINLSGPSTGNVITVGCVELTYDIYVPCAGCNLAVCNVKSTIYADEAAQQAIDACAEGCSPGEVRTSPGSNEMFCSTFTTPASLAFDYISFNGCRDDEPDNCATFLGLQAFQGCSSLTADALVKTPLGFDAFEVMPSTSYEFCFVYNATACNISIGDPCMQVYYVDPTSFLPVELLSFKGSAEAKSNQLLWSTATEQNNSHFELERSQDGERFEFIGEIEGHGTSNSQRNYEFYDENPIETAYYRLKQMDFDGKYEYSDVISIKRGRDKALIIGNIFPSPTKGQAKFNISVAEATQASISIIDVTGKQLSSQTIQLEVGEQQQTIDLMGMPNGIYSVMIIAENFREVKRVVKH